MSGGEQLIVGFWFVILLGYCIVLAHWIVALEARIKKLEPPKE